MIQDHVATVQYTDLEDVRQYCAAVLRRTHKHLRIGQHPNHSWTHLTALRALPGVISWPPKTLIVIWLHLKESWASVLIDRWCSFPTRTHRKEWGNTSLISSSLIHQMFWYTKQQSSFLRPNWQTITSSCQRPKTQHLGHRLLSEALQSTWLLVAMPFAPSSEHCS